MNDYDWSKWNNEYSRKGVCYGCEERHQGCHSDCERYLKQKDEWRKEIEAIINEKQRTRMFGKRVRRKGTQMRRY